MTHGKYLFSSQGDRAADKRWRMTHVESWHALMQCKFLLPTPAPMQVCACSHYLFSRTSDARKVPHQKKVILSSLSKIIHAGNKCHHVVLLVLDLPLLYDTPNFSELRSL